ncbi:melanocyte-stimulating hormone receptor-like [Saccostrea cucullata]|uniref:melanocyte-stimulating hormone receptor-like n=1 Tax=Saccostrea cuccullata TaxID=36930 RepID=UPI002ECFD8CC
MAFYEREVRVPTAEPSKWNSSHIDKETKLNYNSTFWYSLVSPVDQTLQRSLNERKDSSDEFSDIYDFFNVHNLTFHLFNSNAFSLTSEGFEKSTTVLALIIGILGFVGNIVTICTVSCYKKFHTPTFVAISCLALSDALNIIIIFLEKFLALFSYLYIQMSVYRGSFWYMVASFLPEAIVNCSSAHIVFLSIIRYLLVAQPLESKVRLTASIVLACSVMIWFYSSLFTAFILIMLFTILKYYPSQYRIMKLTFVIIRVVWGLFSLCAIVIIHIKKMKALKMSSVTNSIHRRMNVVISIILIVFVCYQISCMYIYISALFYFIFGNSILFMNLLYSYNIVVLLGLLNFSCNPYILFFASMIVS